MGRRVKKRASRKRPFIPVRDELRRKHVNRAMKADHNNSALTAIRLNCLECMGGTQQLVISCDTYGCFLWPYRARGVDVSERPAGSVPSIAEYEEMLEAYWRARGTTRKEAADAMRRNVHAVGGDDAVDDD